MNKNLIGIYTIDGIKGKNKIRINHKCNTILKEDMVIKDQNLEKYPIAKLHIGVATGYVYKCTLTHHYIASTKRLPLYYINVLWVKPIQILSVYRIIVYFDITSKITSADDLIGKEIEGIFSIYAIVDNKEIPLDKNIIKYPGDTEIIANLKKLTVMKDMKEYLYDLIDSKKKEIAKKYGFKNYKIPKNIISLKDININE